MVSYSGRFAVLAAVLFVCIAFLGVPVSAASWNISTVDGTGTDVGGSSLVLDTLGNPHVAYFSDDALRYAVLDGSGWTEETVATFTFGGGAPTLLLDSSGNPHIAFADLDSFSVRYAEYNGTAWSFESVDSSATVAGSVSFALDASDAPHVSYYDESVSDLKYAVRDGLVWENETVDGSGFWPEGQYNSLALNASGYPCISYFGFANDNLKYAAWDGSMWRIEIVDDEPDVGQSTSLVLDAEGHPHISYLNFGDYDLKYAAWDGSAWSIETVGSSSQYVSGGTSLALDASGNPHIAYGANSGLQYAVWNGSVWTFDTVFSDGSVMNPWLHVGASLVLDASGYPHIIYANKTLEDLMYAVQEGTPPPSVPVQVPLSAGWNIISLPVRDATVTLPVEAGQIYRYNGMIYESVSDLGSISPGEGVWMAASGPCTLSFSGTPVTAYTEPVSAGWNMIGSCTDTLPFAGHLESIPPGELNAQVYTYEPAFGMYMEPKSCVPGHGYWVSAKTDCSVTLS